MLTTTDLPLGMISDLSGFSSANVLARVFRIAEGTTPRDFRKLGNTSQKKSRATK
ncbi:MAG: hypothetical protein WDN00_05230 [Limisphaerales bacterium]